MKINGKECYCMGEEYTCEVCGKIFIPTPEWVYRSALTKRKVCSYKCRCKTEHERNERLSNILDAKKYNVIGAKRDIRGGWIEDKKVCADFISLICEDKENK